MRTDNPLHTMDGFKNWDNLIQNCDEIEDLTDQEKERAKRSFQFLREELGENFMAYAVDNWHPLLHKIANLAPWTRRWLTYFADALREAQGYKNYPTLLKKIKDKDGFSEGFSILQIGYKLSIADFKIILEPKGEIPNWQRVPDVKLVDKSTGEELLLEVSVLESSSAEKKAYRTMNEVLMAIMRSGPHLNFRGRIHKALSDRHLAQIIRDVQKLVEEVKKDNASRFLEEDDVIELGVAPDKDMESLRKWATERGIESGLAGPPYGENAIERIRGKIAKEQKQLPPGCANMVAIMSDRLFIEEDDIKAAINDIEEEVYEYPHLIAVIIFSSDVIGIGEIKTITKDQHLYIERTRFKSTGDRAIFLLNKYCDVKVNPVVIEKVLGALRNY